MSSPRFRARAVDGFGDVPSLQGPAHQEDKELASELPDRVRERLCKTDPSQWDVVILPFSSPDIGRSTAKGWHSGLETLFSRPIRFF